MDKLVKFTGKQIAKINAQAVAAFSDEYWDKVPVYHIVYFGADLLQSAGVLERMNATHVAFVSAKLWRSVPMETIVKFSVEKLQAIDYNGLAGWSKKMWDKVPIDTIASFIDKQIEAIPRDVVGNWTQSMWLKFDAEQAVMFTGEQLIAGANALKDMSQEQLSKYDWSQISEDALAKLPPELQDKIKKLRTFATTFNVTKYKQLVARKVQAIKVKNQKLEALQIIQDNPTATSTDKQKAQKEYHESVVMSKQLTDEVGEENLQMYALPTTAGVASPGARAAASGVTVLLAALLLQGWSMHG